MNEQIQRQLLETEYLVMTEQLAKLGHATLDTSPNKDGTLAHLSTNDLRALTRQLRDLIRTLGGARE